MAQENKRQRVSRAKNKLGYNKRYLYNNIIIDNSVDIQDLYQFRFLKTHPNSLFVRNFMCHCRCCVIGLYDKCIFKSGEIYNENKINTNWREIDIKISKEKDTVVQRRIAEFYHLESWDSKCSKNPPLIAFRHPKTLQLHLAVLQDKPFINTERITQKNNPKKVVFSCYLNTWCIKVQLLIEYQKTRGTVFFIPDNDDNSKDIVIPTSKLIIPSTIENIYQKYYAAFNFIFFIKSESYKPTAIAQEINITNYKIKDDVIDMLYELPYR